MDIGIGLPNAVRGVDRRGIVEWAKRAEEAGFSSLGTIDRIAYENYESLIALAAAAAVTERIRLVTDILLAPLRSNTALFAKQTATLDSLSNGRLVLGLAVGGRSDDYEISNIDFAARGRIFEQQLQDLTDAWAGDTIGPAPANGRRPGLLVGGSSQPAFRRAARYADGWTMGGGAPDQFKQGLTKVREAWRDAQRVDEPRTMVLMYYSLGPNAERVAAENLGDYYSFLGEYAERVVASTAKDEDTVRAYLSAFEQAGADEVICFPASTDVEQVDLLARAVNL